MSNTSIKSAWTSRRFVALLPHRDSLSPLRAWQEALFRAGLSGAWAFPQALILAAPDRGLRREELKTLAGLLRAAASPDAAKGKRGVFHAGHDLIVRDLGGLVLGGLKLDKAGAFAAAFAAEGREMFPDPFLCAFAAPPERAEAWLRLAQTLPPPPIRFRAAALVNILFSFSTDGAFQTAWTCGSARWLPKHPAPLRGDGA